MQRWPAANAALGPNEYLYVAIASPTRGIIGGIWSCSHLSPLPLSLRLDSELFAMGSVQFINIVMYYS